LPFAAILHITSPAARPLTLRPPRSSAQPTTQAAQQPGRTAGCCRQGLQQQQCSRHGDKDIHCGCCTAGCRSVRRECIRMFSCWISCNKFGVCCWGTMQHLLRPW
jgi:hypothetical protein